MGVSQVKSEGSPAALDGRRLLLRHRNGDMEAFPQLVDLYRRQVYSYITRSGIPAEARDDLFQETFLKIHSGAKSFDQSRELDPWLFAVLANTVRSYHRKTKTAVLAKSETRPSVQNKESAEDCALGRETQLWLESRIAELPAPQREVILLCCIKNLSQQDVAEIMGLPSGTVKTLLHRARAELALALARRKAAASREVSQ